MTGQGTIKMIPIYVMGRKYLVPEGLTILKALEYSGYRVIRGCGCRGGVCGACVTVYRKNGDYRLRFGLACQTLVEADIYLTQLPYTPAHRALYTITKTSPEDLNALYPELMRCVACNTCTKSCPMGLDVMNYMAAAIRGDLKEVVQLSMECVMCGVCAARCPAEIAPFNIALLIRRIYASRVLSPSPQLALRLREIRECRFDGDLDVQKQSGKEDLIARHEALQATKGEPI